MSKTKRALGSILKRISKKLPESSRMRNIIDDRRYMSSKEIGDSHFVNLFLPENAGLMLKVQREIFSKGGYSFEQLEKDHPELVQRATELVAKYYIEGGRKSHEIIEEMQKEGTSQNRKSELNNEYREEFNRFMEEYHRAPSPTLYELYLILRKKGLKNKPIIG
ncbi:MAG: hypothetical protein ABID38_00475 [Candidatus Diapherotrites archaeon]